MLEGYFMYEQDYIMRQIRDLVRFLAKVFLNKDVAIYNIGKYEDIDTVSKALKGEN